MKGDSWDVGKWGRKGRKARKELWLNNSSAKNKLKTSEKNLSAR